MYGRDLKKSIGCDDFMGQGFKEAMEMCDKEGIDLEVGTFFKVDDWIKEAEKQIRSKMSTRAWIRYTSRRQDNIHACWGEPR